ncbi:MAG: hypothetical protein U1E52_10025 [Geminicoccaceae bacterium]
MAQLLVRGLSEETIRLLRERAKAHGRSVEAEHRSILEDAVGESGTSSDLAAALQSLSWLAELDAAELRGDDPPRDFSFDAAGTTVAHARTSAGHDRSD